MQHQRFCKCLLTLCLLLGMTVLLVGQPARVVAQNTCLPLCIANDNVGVGTNTPATRLEVHGTDPQASDKLLRLTREGKNTAVSLDVAPGDYGYFGLGGLTELRGNGQPSRFDGLVTVKFLQTIENISVGTSTLDTRLHIHGTDPQASDHLLFLTREGKNTAINLDVAAGDYGYLGLGGATELRGNGQPSNFEGLVTVKFLQTSQNVGIGTPLNPQAKLDVAGTTRTQVLQITGGSDLAEPFVVSGMDTIESGTVVVLDPANPGQLRMADSAYDTLVAGIVSGAGGITPGLIMQQESATIDGETHPIALTGKVYVKAVGPIKIGDLLTTSAIPGHAMAATDRDRAFGATLGKAMSPLAEETGLVLVLVALQ